MYLKSIDNLRGVAMIAIVSCHLFNFGLIDNDWITLYIKNTLIGTSSLYVFISGFMFYHVFYKSFNYHVFLSKKLISIVIPYFFLASLAILLLWLFKMGYFTPMDLMKDPNEAYRDGNIFSPNDNALTTIIKYYISGRMMTAYWYIPFAVILFLSAPLHMRYIHMSLRNQVVILIAFSFLATFCHRPVSVTNPLHSYIFYTPFYLYGILLSMYREQVLKYIGERLILIATISFALLSLQVYFGDVGNYTKPFFKYEGADLQFLQKLFLIAIVFYLFEKLPFESKIVSSLSKYSFSIYLIHPWVVLVLYSVGNRYGYMVNDKLQVKSILVFISMVILVLSCSIVITKCFKWIMRGSNRTRYITGY
ncbi:acyltransferase family protein [Vibrio maerlii]|uniref:acyltransferase family protein n=1 Tax=Vibrio maerlii TaxID=2231648 RepID=UPI000E3C680F|nr:acyltransferase [Vibrio maerlii]